jgi:hypothetical protein
MVYDGKINPAAVFQAKIGEVYQLAVATEA